MAVPTAIGFLVSSLALLVQSGTPTDGRGQRFGIRGLPAVAALICGVATLAYFLWISPTKPEAPSATSLGAAQRLVNRTSPNTALNLILLATSLCLIDSPVRKRGTRSIATHGTPGAGDDLPRWPSQVLALTVILDAFFALLGQAYGLTLLYGLSHTIGMALPTSLAFLVLGLGVLAARPDRGFVKILLSRNVAGEAARRLLPIIIAVPLVLGGITLLGFHVVASFASYLLVVASIVMLVSLFWGTIQTLHQEVERALSFERQLSDQAIAIERQAVEIERASMLVQQRRFVRELLASVTEGRLFLCDTAGDLPERSVAVSDLLQLTPVTLKQLRRRVAAAAEQLGFPEERTHDLVTAAGEAGMNAVKHGGGGTARVHSDLGRRLVQVSIEDTGTGIREQDLHRATLEKGWSSAGSFGHGFYLMLRTVDRTYLLTGADGTTVILEQEAAPPIPVWQQVA